MPVEGRNGRRERRGEGKRKDFFCSNLLVILMSVYRGTFFSVVVRRIEDTVQSYWSPFSCYLFLLFLLFFWPWSCQKKAAKSIGLLVLLRPPPLKEAFVSSFTTEAAPTGP